MNRFIPTITILLGEAAIAVGMGIVSLAAGVVTAGVLLLCDGLACAEREG